MIMSTNSFDLEIHKPDCREEKHVAQEFASTQSSQGRGCVGLQPKDEWDKENPLQEGCN